MPSPEPAPVTFNDPAVQRCPFAAYEEVRALGPIYREPDTGFFVVVDHRLIKRIASDPKTFSSETGIFRASQNEEVMQIYRDSGVVPIEGLVVGDGAEHAFQRGLVQSTFTPPRVKAMEDYLVGVVDECIDSFAERGRAEMFGELALPVPMRVIADQLGMPREDAHMLKFWTDAAAENANPLKTLEREKELARIAVDFQDYILAKAHHYREQPADCLLSDLVHTKFEGKGLDDGRLVSVIGLLLQAGNETTTNAITHALAKIVGNRALETSLREHPERIPAFVDETLRFEAPLQALFRRATEDVEIEGVSIPAQSIVILRWGAGNRDPAAFDRPDDFDPDRTNTRGLLTFGYGPHFCLGSNLARSEVRLVIERLLGRLCNLRWASDEGNDTERMANYIVLGYTRMDIAFDRLGA